MAIPLTLAMSINVSFVVGAVFVPGLWSVVEYLFPVALAGFLAVGIYALRLYGRYLARIIATGTFDFIANASLSQLVPIFAFAMIAVGFAAPGAMSHRVEINAIGIFLSISRPQQRRQEGFVRRLSQRHWLRHPDAVS